jgi:hypothetical protein
MLHIRFRFVIAAAVLFSAAACTANPTATPVAAPQRPLLDGGYGLGSGNKSDSTHTQTNTASMSSGAALGGYGLGSGN